MTPPLINVANFRSFWPRPWTKEGQRMKNWRKEGGLFSRAGSVSAAPDAHDKYQGLCHVPLHGVQKRSRGPRRSLISQSCFCFSVSLMRSDNLQQNKRLSFTHSQDSSGPLALPHGHCYHSHKEQTEWKQTDERTEDEQLHDLQNTDQLLKEEFT